MAADPYRYFRVEARELVEQLGQGALDLEKGIPSSELIARLLRLAHTLKGAARVVRQPLIADEAHALEDVFTTLRERAAPPARDQIDDFLARVDRIADHLDTLGPVRSSETPLPDTGRPEEPVHLFRPAAADLEALVEGAAEVQRHLAALRPTLDEADRVRHLIDLIGDQLGRGRARDGSTNTASDKTLSIVQELRTRFGALERDVLYGVDEMERELRQVSDAAARLRLVPASAIFRFLERAARDAAQVVGKPVVFEGRGGEVRVDSEILATVQGALLQVVRNAVAHGIEASADERRTAGKPSPGQITVSVVRRGASVSFVCSDDGHGIDVEAVRRQLVQTGRLGADSQNVSPEALLRLLLKGGLSTAASVTAVAGRGVGLDVVREAAERLGAHLDMKTEPGRGTSVELVIPFSVSSFRAIVVESGGVSAAIPLDAVTRTLRVVADAIIETAQGDWITDEGRNMPCVSLKRIVRPGDAPERHQDVSVAVVVEAAAGAAAFVVDRIVGAETVVMRPLPDLTPAMACVVGAALDAAGHPRLVLDAASLVTDAQRLGAPATAAPSMRPSILVIDDSLTTRMLEQSILESAGYEVGLASSGEEGLDKARRGSYSLFLVDVEMPGMDGFTFIERARTDPALRNVPAILVTSRASAEDQRRGVEAGAQGFMGKADFDQGALLAQIRGLVQ